MGPASACSSTRALPGVIWPRRNIVHHHWSCPCPRGRRYLPLPLVVSMRALRRRGSIFCGVSSHGTAPDALTFDKSRRVIVRLIVSGPGIWHSSAGYTSIPCQFAPLYRVELGDPPLPRGRSREARDFLHVVQHVPAYVGRYPSGVPVGGASRECSSVGMTTRCRNVTAGSIACPLPPSGRSAGGQLSRS